MVAVRRGRYPTKVLSRAALVHCDRPVRSENICRMGSPLRRALVTMLLLFGLVLVWRPPVHAQAVGDVFRKVAPSVVVIRAKGGDITTQGQTHFTETGSGVLV